MKNQDWTVREPLNLEMPVLDFLLTMAEGNPGAVMVLVKLLEIPGGFMLVLNLDDMNIRGTQIWVAYKAHCHESLEELKDCLMDPEKRPELVKTINEWGLRGNHPWKAVDGRASGSKEREKLSLADYSPETLSKVKIKKVKVADEKV